MCIPLTISELGSACKQWFYGSAKARHSWKAFSWPWIRRCWCLQAVKMLKAAACRKERLAPASPFNQRYAQLISTAKTSKHHSSYL